MCDTQWDEFVASGGAAAVIAALFSVGDIHDYFGFNQVQRQYLTLGLAQGLVNGIMGLGLSINNPNIPIPCCSSFDSMFSGFPSAFTPETQVSIMHGLFQQQIDTILQQHVGGLANHPVADMITITRRDEWGALNATRYAHRGTWTGIVIHHTATPPTSNFGTHGSEWTYHGRVMQIDNHHLNNNRWSGGVGYHFLIAPDGTIFEGRPLDWGGAHALNPPPNRNHSHIGIGLLGYYDPTTHGNDRSHFNPNQPIPPQAQRNAMWWLIDHLTIDNPAIRSIEPHQPGDPGPWFYDFFESGTLNTFRGGTARNQPNHEMWCPTCGGVIQEAR